MSNLIFDEAEYLQFLSACIRETPFLQNSASNCPEESRIANLVTQHLQTFIDRGIIRCDRYEYVPNRANLILEYGPETATQTITLAGSHFDVVPANPTLWERNPFELIIEGDKLYGRGTTDCLGHVALVTLLLKQLAIHQIQLNFRLIVVFIADEEYGKDPTIGVLRLNQEGHLEKIKQGPVYWLDASDIVPVRACGSAMAWTLTVHGKKAHSGFPHNGINPLPIAMEAVKAIVQYFNTLCPRCDKDDEYEFPSSSNMKPTVWEMSPGSSANQYADWARVTGDVRMTPFYDVFEIKTKILEFVETLDIHQLPKWHESFGTKLEDAGATLEFKWVFGPYCGIACDTSSSGYQLIQQATSLHHDSCSRCSDLGAVPLVRELQDSGIDIQIIGYGNSDAYHANNEYCTLSGMKKGFAILSSLLALANDD